MDFKKIVNEYGCLLKGEEQDTARAVFNDLLDMGFSYDWIWIALEQLEGKVQENKKLFFNLSFQEKITEMANENRNFASDVEGLLFNGDIYGILEETRQNEEIPFSVAKQIQFILEGENISLIRISKTINEKYKQYQNEEIPSNDIEDMFRSITRTLEFRIWNLTKEQKDTLRNLIEKYS